MKNIIERAGAYLAAMPASVSGQGGHAAAYAAAAALIKGFGLTEAEALPLLLQWNQACLPPWSERELRHKLRSATTTSTRTDGYLLADDRPQAGASAHICLKTRAHARLRPGLPPHSPQEAQSEADLKASKRLAWPRFYLPEKNDLEEISRLRGGIPLCGLHIAMDRGLLKNARCGEKDCYILHEERFAQARHYDGSPFFNAAGRACKTRNLPGSEGAFFGRSLLREARHVLLVEGAFGLVEALTALTRLPKNEGNTWAALAATSAASRFARDPVLLRALAGRHVRILPDADETGMNAAASWLADLRGAGATVDVMELSDGHKDLGSLLACESQNSEPLTSLFQ